MSISAASLPQISARRRRTDKVMRGLLLAATIIALIPLVLIIYYLIHKGLSAWTQSGFFTTDPTGSFFGSPGGIRSAILGSLEIVLLGDADLDPDRDRRGAVPDRIREGGVFANTCGTSST